MNEPYEYKLDVMDGGMLFDRGRKPDFLLKKAEWRN